MWNERQLSSWGRIAEQGQSGGQLSSSPTVVGFLGHFHQRSLYFSLWRTLRRPQRTAGWRFSVEPKDFQDRNLWSSPWLPTLTGSWIGGQLSLQLTSVYRPVVSSWGRLILTWTRSEG